MPEAPDPGPVRGQDRLLAPDLARGLALLGIALANSVSYSYGRDLGPLLRPVDGSPADRLVDAVVGVLVDNRAFPVFTMLFAYGYVMILRRQAAGGVPWLQARRLLVRRSAWLAVFGALHLLLLFSGDIVLAYGLLGLALVTVLRWRDRSLLLLGASTLAVFVVLGALDGTSGAPLTGVEGLVDPASFLGALAVRAAVLGSTLLAAPFLVLALAPAAVVGVLLARRGVLEDPGAHLPLLRRSALLGLPISVVGAVPLVLVSTRVVELGPVATTAAAALHGGTGLAGAVGFVGLVGWFSASGAGTAPTRGVVRGLSAVGARSLTCYLLQSVLFVALLAPWSYGLGVGAGTALLATVAVGVYLVTSVVAVSLAAAGRSGPAEVLLRRLVHRSAPAGDQRVTAPG